MSVVEFTQSRRADTRYLITCPECRSVVFKVVRYGASSKARLECAVCEFEITNAAVTDEEPS